MAPPSSTTKDLGPQTLRPPRSDFKTRAISKGEVDSVAQVAIAICAGET